MSLLAGVAIGIALIWAVRLRRLRCDCNHPHWLFQPHHERVAVMIFYAALLAGGLVLNITGSTNRVGALILLSALWLQAYRIWAHEHARRKKASRALGRVVVDLHGRLRVASA